MKKLFFVLSLIFFLSGCMSETDDIIYRTNLNTPVSLDNLQPGSNFVRKPLYESWYYKDQMIYGVSYLFKKPGLFINERVVVDNRTHTIMATLAKEDVPDYSEDRERFSHERCKESLESYNTEKNISTNPDKVAIEHYNKKGELYYEIYQCQSVVPGRWRFMALTTFPQYVQMFSKQIYYQ